MIWTACIGSRSRSHAPAWAISNVPVPARGFGISSREHLERLRGKVDAAIVGSALIDHITEDDPAGSAAAFVTQLRGGPAVGS